MTEIVKIKHENGDEFVLQPNYEKFYICKIEGLSYAQNDINISNNGVQPGGIYNSNHVNVRNIIITIVLFGNNDSERKKLYKIFPQNYPIIFHYKNEEFEVTTEAHVESLVPTPYLYKENVQISLICPNPYFEAIDKIQAEISCSLAGLQFQLDIPPEGIVISERYPYPINIINNPGDVSVGFTAEIRVADAEPDITVTSVRSQTPEAIMQRRVLMPLSLSDYNPQTMPDRYLAVFVNSVRKSSGTDYTTEFVTYSDNSRDLLIYFNSSILSLGDTVTVHVYEIGDKPIQTDGETKPLIWHDLTTDSYWDAWYSRPSWVDTAENVVAKMYQNGEEIVNGDGWTCTIELTTIHVKSDNGVNPTSTNPITVVVLGTIPNQEIDKVVPPPSIIVSIPEEIFFTSSNFDGRSEDAVRYYMGSEKLTGITVEQVTATGGTESTYYYLNVGKPMTGKITVNFYSKEGTDISDYTDEQIDVGMKLVDNLVLKNMTTGEEMKFTGEKFKPGDVIGISTVSGDIRVYCVDSDWAEQGQNLMYALDGNSSFPKLRPGENRIVITSDTNQDLLSGYLEAKKLYGGV